jgi:uncharacterized membrane protein YidH (DUF202 family)
MLFLAFTVNILSKIKSEILNPLILLLFALAVGYFLFGVMKFIQNQDNEEAQTQGKQHMVWGIVGIFLMIAVYGILGFITTTLGVPKVSM